MKVGELAELDINSLVSVTNLLELQDEEAGYVKKKLFLSRRRAQNGQ